MPTNFYFNNFPANQVTQEQLLVEDLVIEAMKIHGMDVYYLPRTSRDEVDYLYGEDTLKQYKSAYPIEMYLENVSGMDGEGDFISKFGLEIRDEVSLLVSRRRFKYSVGAANITRPREGDLIYVPLVGNFFEITFVEHENDQAMFYTLGRGRGGNVYVYALKLKQFVFSEEVISTGIDEIDANIRDAYKKTQITLAAGGTGTYVADEIVYQSPNNLANATSQAVVHTWNASTRKLDIILVRGTFSSNTAIKGETSSAIWTSATAGDDTAFDDNPFEDIIDNSRIQREADSIIDFTENNPFGEV
jgi:hypothetical protein